MFKVVVALTLLVVVKVLATPLHTRPVEEVAMVALEEPCVRQGGMCMRREHCDTNDVVKFVNLCPKQSHSGVVCCYN